MTCIRMNGASPTKKMVGLSSVQMLTGRSKCRIGDKVCMIGGFDQVNFFKGCTPEQTRAEVRRCFEEAGDGGEYILSPSDHFFDADLNLLEAFADEARKCIYQYEIQIKKKTNLAVAVTKA